MYIYVFIYIYIYIIYIHTHTHTYIYIYIYIKDYCNNYIVKRQTFAVDAGYYWYLIICIYNLQACYETSIQNKKEENLDILKVLILPRLLLRFI